MTAALLATGQDAGSGRSAQGPPQGAARAAYSRGLYQALGADGGAESLRSFEEASRLEPRNAAVAAALAQSWVRAVQEGRVTPREGMPRAREAAARAVALGDHPAGHLVLGTVALRHDWDWDAAERSLGRALARDPGSAPAHLEMADLLLVRGQAGGRAARSGARGAARPRVPRGARTGGEQLLRARAGSGRRWKAGAVRCSSPPPWSVRTSGSSMPTGMRRARRRRWRKRRGWSR